MKRIVASALFASALVLNACGTDVDLGDRPNYRYGNNNLTMFVFDSQSGGVLDNATVTVNVAGDNLASEFSGNAYVVNGIPNGLFPVTISAPGFLSVTGIQAFNNGTDVTSPTSQPGFQTFTVGMYPVTAVAEDVIIKVYDSNTGAQILNGDVSAKLTPTGIDTPGGAGTSPFSGTVGFTPSVVRATLTNGAATLPKASLVHGGTYTVTVSNARNPQSQYLQPSTTTFKAGTTFSQLVVFMGPPAVEPVALSANTENPGSLPNLVVTFPYPVTVCSDQQTWGWTNTAGTSIAPRTSSPVRATLGSGLTQLTVDYNIEGADNTAESLSVNFTGIRVAVSGGADCVALGDVSLRGTSSRVDTEIVVRVVP